MGDEYTRKQIRDWLDRAVSQAKNPDPIKLAKAELKIKRQKKRKTVASRNGL